MCELSQRLEVAIQAARQAGEYLIRVLPEQRNIDKKGAVNLVTEADRVSEKIIHELIGRIYPQDQFLSEEGIKTCGETDFVWIVDPLDGTTNYAHRLPHFCISIGLTRNGQPLAGCIYNPNSDECFTAIKGKKAFLNGDRITVSTIGDLDDALLATGFPYDVRESRDDNMDNFIKFYKKAQAVRRMGSAALDLAYLACGRFDGFWEFKLSPWDVAAGVLLVEEANGTITDFRGGQLDIFKGEVLASNGLIHQAMIDVLGSKLNDFLSWQRQSS